MIPNLALQPCRTPPPLPPSSTVFLSPTLSPFLQSSAVSPFFTCRTPPPTNRFCAQSMDLPFGTCAKAHCCAACVGSSSSPGASCATAHFCAACFWHLCYRQFVTRPAEAAPEECDMDAAESCRRLQGAREAEAAQNIEKTAASSRPQAVAQYCRQ